MAQSVTPEDFNVVRGRGYHPDQVDAYTADRCRERDAAEERCARLSARAEAMESEAAALRTAADSLDPVGYEALGEGAQELYRMVCAEAEDVRDRAEEAARAAYEEAERDARAARERARADADARLTAADEAAREVQEAARRHAADIVGAAQSEARRLDADAERALEGVRQDIARSLSELEKEQRGRLEAMERELGTREADVDGRLGELTARAERLLAEAQRRHVEAEEHDRRLQAKAEEKAAGLIAQARATEERVNLESERALRAHGAHRDEIRSHLAHVRTSLSALTGRTPPPEDGAED